jgi:hypothetical protein
MLITREGSANRYRFTVESEIESETIGGAVACATTSLFLDDQRGAFECTGAHDSVVRLLVRDSGPFLDLYVDEEGSGEFSFVAVDAGTGYDPTLDFYTDNSYHDFDTPRPFPVDPPLPSVPMDSLSININGAVVHPSGNPLYVTTDAGVSVIDLDTMTETTSVPLANPAHAIAISDDGSTLWVGFDFISEVVTVDTVTLMVSAPVELGNLTTAPGEPRRAYDIEVEPGTTDRIVIGDISGRETFAMYDGSVLPDILNRRFGAPRSLTFQDATTLIGYNGAVGSVVKLDDNGLTIEKEISGFGASGTSPERGPITGGSLVYSRWGQVYDFVNDAIFGTVKLDSSGIGSGTRDGAVLDSSTNTIYFYNRSFPTSIEFYDATTLVPLGAYAPPSSPGSPRIMLLDGLGHMIIASSEGVHSLSLADLQPNRRKTECQTRDFSGIRSPGTYFEIDCEFNDVVFDKTRNLLYASVPGDEAQANSIAVIDALSAAIIEYIPVGSEPGPLALSADARWLWVPLQGASRAVAVDLDSRSVVSTIDFALEPDSTAEAAAPLTPKSVAVSPSANDDVLFSHNFDGVIRFFSAGVQAQTDVDVNFQNRVDHVYFTGNSNRAVSYFFNNLQVLSVDANGVNELTEVADIVTGRHIKIRGDLVYSSEGEIFDVSILASRSACNLPEEPIGQPYRWHLALSEDPNVVYYYRRTVTELLTCDIGTGEIVSTVYVPNVFDGDGFPRALVEAGPDRMVLAISSKMILFDHRALPRNLEQ